MVECHKEPTGATVPAVALPVPAVTPGAVPVVAGTTPTLVTVGLPIAIDRKVPLVATATATAAAAAKLTGVSISNSNSSTNNSSPASIVKSSTPKLSNLPTLSVSGPSPPHEEEFL